MTAAALRTPPVELLEGRVQDVAPRLLNTLLAVDGRVGRIVEVEAYGAEDDPASHAAKGSTPRNASMFCGPGTLYVYRSYGMHWCANVVTGSVGRASAVLIRALEPVAGVEEMWVRRPRVRRPIDLANGPGKLCAALGITGDHDGGDLLDERSPVRWLTDGTPPPREVLRTPRIGISRAVDRLWRFVAAGEDGAA